jgi:hypothetical protein
MKTYSKFFFLTAIMILSALASVRAVAPANDNFVNAQNLGSGLTGSVPGTNVEATQETDEPNHYTQNPNKQSVWYKWTAPASRSMSFEEIDENVASAMAIYTASVANPTFAQLTQINVNADLNGYNYTGCRLNFWAQSGKTYYIAIDYANAGGPGSQTGNFQLKFFPNKFAYSAKFESRNQRTSVPVFRPETGMWYFLWNAYSSSYETIYGKNGDKPAPADYDGDGRTDIAIVRNENGAKLWYVGFISTTIWGLPTDQPLLGDFDNDGRADLTAVRNNGQNLVWYVRRSFNGSMMTFTWGSPNDKPVIADFDGDGMTDVTVTRATPGGLVWYILKSNNGGFNQSEALQFGIESDIAATEDFDGDGKSDVAVFRPSNGTWYILRSGTNELQSTQFGAAGDKPQPADYDGDGKADLGLYRASEGKWYFWMSGNNTQKVVRWGTATDMPASSFVSLTN